jgi:hypothetical protein
LAELRKAYRREDVEAKIDPPGMATKEDFQEVLSILEKLAAQSAEPVFPVASREQKAFGAPQQEFALMAQFYDNGFVRTTDNSSMAARELTSPTLTSDGRDLLDALRTHRLGLRSSV